MSFYDFHYAYRFNDEKYKCLPKEVLDRIIVLDKEECKEIWDKNFDKDAHHYKLCKNVSIVGEVCDNCGWGEGNEEEISVILNDIEDKSSEIILFWSIGCAIKTEWEIFSKYWSDFCYPSDDGNILLLDNQILVYDEDQLFRVKFEKLNKEG